MIIVGGGPAGLSTALHLQRRVPVLARDILVLEKHRFPREKICGGAIARRGDEMLARIGVQVDVPSAPVNAMCIRFPGRVNLGSREGDIGRVVRRVEFDHALAKNAMDRGVEILQGAEVARVTPEHDGVDVELADGRILRAQVVVGADGVGGVVRRSVFGKRPRLRAQVVEVDTEPCTEDDQQTLLLDFVDCQLRGYAWDFPTIVDGQRMMCRGVYLLRGDRAPNSHGLSARDFLSRHLERRGLSIENTRVKHFAEHGFDSVQSAALPRVLLVGEAAGIDIATGEGIAQAIAYGDVGAKFLERAFARRDFSFARWPAALRRTSLGRRLLLRYAAYTWFYRTPRRNVADALARRPELVRAGILDFAGLPIPKHVMFKVAAQVTSPILRRSPGLLSAALGRGRRARG